MVKKTRETISTTEERRCATLNGNQLENLSAELLQNRETAKWKTVAGWALLTLMASVALFAVGETPGRFARVKDVATIEGIRDNQLVGYGLVVGLHGTG